jgi:hypothetical protein
MKNYLFAVIIIFVLLRNAQGQGFVNLDFEDAVIVPDPSSPYYPYAVYSSDAIPGWTILPGNFLGTNEITYNALSTGSTAIALVGTDDHFGPDSLDGNYSIDLYGGVLAGAASISQTGVVPALTESIFFEAQGGGGTLQLSLGGQTIPFFALSTGANYTLYGGSIPSNFSGQSEQLVLSASQQGGNNFWEIDDIQFSPLAVPEPSELALGALGALLLAFRRWRNFFY